VGEIISAVFIVGFLISYAMAGDGIDD